LCQTVVEIQLTLWSQWSDCVKNMGRQEGALGLWQCVESSRPFGKKQRLDVERIKKKYTDSGGEKRKLLPPCSAIHKFNIKLKATGYCA